MPRRLSRPALAAAAGLSALAGYVDGIAFVFLGGYFVSFMSGNTTQGSVELVRGGSWWLAFVLVVAFVAGVVGGSLLGRMPARRESAVLGLVAALLLVGALLATAGYSAAAGAALAAAMGAVNTVFIADGQAVGLTYMTGALVKVGQELVAAFRGGSRWGWAPHLVLWVAIAGGAVLGAAVYSGLGIHSLWLAVAGAAIGAVVAWRRR